MSSGGVTTLEAIATELIQKRLLGTSEGEPPQSEPTVGECGTLADCRGLQWGCQDNYL